MVSIGARVTNEHLGHSVPISLLCGATLTAATSISAFTAWQVGRAPAVGARRPTNGLRVWVLADPKACVRVEPAAPDWVTPAVPSRPSRSRASMGVAAVADRVGLSLPTILRWRSAGRLPGRTVGIAQGREIWLRGTI